MSVQIRIDGGFQIEKSLFFGYAYAHNGLINLASEMGADMRYNEGEICIVDYPGEYDIRGWTIKAFVGQNAKLNYLIQGNGKKFGIIQSSDVLELEEVDGMDTWLYLGESIEKKLDQLELEGERINLMEFSEEK
ncbi:hypothetical protein D8B45_01740 [Candidatus Gracilibacteria bacterium]|nr:MAG: hypothetical protein D8B45_01740 [Candidatus Gracilibacteria bacterium]